MTSSPFRPFLHHVAADLLQTYGSDLSRVAVVFPGKRASLFLNDYLAQQSERPLWAPRYFTITELIGTLTPLRGVDTIEAVCRLYRLYKAETGADDTLDFFYGWGERLLLDFDDVDKNLAAADRLFRNLYDLKELSDTDFLTPEQVQVLQRFFSDFTPENNTLLRQRFLTLWNALLPLYQQLNATLRAEGKGYEGARYRDAVTRLKEGRAQLPADLRAVAFVGFNVLSQSETELMAHLQREGIARFYWDYDEFYTSATAPYEAGTFLRENLLRFPCALPPEAYRNLQGLRHIEFVAAESEGIQAASVAPWLEAHLTREEERQTAVVLCNEDLLQPVLRALPEAVTEVNITRGFPLGQSTVFTLIERKARAAANFAQKDAAADNNPLPASDTGAERAAASESAAGFRFLTHLLEEVTLAAQQHEATKREGEAFDEAATEAYFRAVKVIGRFRALCEAGWLDVGLATLQRLLRQVLRREQIPFHGEPAVGVQVMGVLETRCLDFSSLLILSCNEGRMPRSAADNSFIPLALRREFGLTTPRHRTAVYAYYFYRLLQRARHVRIVYSEAAGVTQGAEMSRFMTQLLLESTLPITRLKLSAPLAEAGQPSADAEAAQTPSITPEAAESATTSTPAHLPLLRPDDLVERLHRLSPSALNVYRCCPRQFYFQHVLGLRETEATGEMLEANELGTVFHGAMQLLYEDCMQAQGDVVTAAMIAPYLEARHGEALLREYITRSARENKLTVDLLSAEVVLRYMQNMLAHDRAHAPFRIVAFEKKYYTHVTTRVKTPTGEEDVEVEVGGTIDRIDEMEIRGVLHRRILDYKTGSDFSRVTSLEKLFAVEANPVKYEFQVCLYALTQLDETTLPLAPGLLFVARAAQKDYSPYIELGKGKEKAPILDFRPLAEAYRGGLSALLSEILSAGNDFAPLARGAGERGACKFCPYATLCSYTACGTAPEMPASPIPAETIKP